MTAEIRYYAILVLRRLPIILGICILTSTAGAIVAINLPETYRSESAVLIEPPEIPENLAASTVQINPYQEIEVVRQRLQTRSNLLSISRQYQIFPDQPDMSADEIVDAMRSNLSIGAGVDPEGPAILEIGYNARTARIAAAVVNEMTTQVVGQSRRTAAQSAQQTTGFFQRQVNDLNEQLQEANAQILQFQNENSEALPSTLDFRLSRQTELQEQISSIDQNVTSLERQKERLREIFEATGRISAQRELSPEEAQLENLREELASALAIYSESNPKVRVLQARIDRLEGNIAANAGSEADTPTQQSMFDIEIARIDSQIETEMARRESLAEELSGVTDTIRQTPANDIALRSMQRDYQNLQAQYNQAVQSLSTAQTGERIEDQARGRRMTILEEPTEPTEPAGPNRPGILAAGVAAGLGISGGIIVLLELLNGAFRRPIELQRRMGITPLATIPHIYTRGEKLRQNTIRAAIIIAIAAGIPAILAAIHYYYLPLGVIASEFIDRFNL